MRRDSSLMTNAAPSFALLVATTLLSALTACTPARWHETATPHTGDVAFEKQTVRPKAPLTQGQEVFVASERLRARANPDQPGEEALVLLEKNDKIEVVDPTPKGELGLIEVRLIEDEPRQTESTPPESSSPQAPAPAPAPAPPPKPTTVFVPPQYLSDEPIASTPAQTEADRYFVIQNVATEKLRVYERCAEKSCAHKLVLETDMAAGEDTPDRSRRTILGSYRITKWFKFYQDTKDQYPSWYDPEYPEIPAPGADLKAWTAKSLLPNGKGYVRGAFGWYTAHIGPNADAQWTHGTFGWGADRGRFVRITPKDIQGLAVDPRSHGCTRVENQAIAFLREFLPVGSKIIKIYAKEAVRDPELKRYQDAPKKWSWILTKDGVRADGSKAGKLGQLGRDVQPQDILEEGALILDHHPDAIAFASTPQKKSRSNIYAVPEKSLQGVFFVDEGRVAGYRHPKELKVGGYSDKLLPSIVNDPLK